MNNETNENKIVCCKCNTILENENGIYCASDDNYYCEDCANEWLTLCYDCGEYVTNDETIYIEDLDRYICTNCYNNGGYFYCEHCNNYYSEDCARDSEDGTICDNCASDYYYYCDGCNMYVHETTEEDGYYYCSRCISEMFGDYKRYGYHGFSDWQLYKNEDETNPPFYIGFENETENYGEKSYRHGLKVVYENLNAVCMYDGSISCNGFEIVNHPQTFNYYMANKDNIKKAFEELQALGYKSHDTNTCGLHFHVTRPSEDVIDKIWLVMETYKDELVKFSRRTSDNLTHWASFMSDKGLDTKAIDSLYFIKKHKGNFNRYMALNLENSATIEFRLFRGTLNFATFMASLELVNNIVTLCSACEDVTAITWDKLIEGDYVKAYCLDKDILTDKKIKDNSAKYIRLENRRKNIMSKIINYFRIKIVADYQSKMKRVNRELKAADLLQNISDNYNTLDGMYSLTSQLNSIIRYANNGNWASFKSYVKDAIWNFNAETKNAINELLEKGED